MSVWPESKAQLALSVLNEKVAAIFCKPVRADVRFVFAPLIDQRRILTSKGIVTTKETVGSCDTR